MFNTKTKLRAALSAALLAAGFGFVQPALADDPVILTFSTMGDSRLESTDSTLQGQDKKWLQNSKVLARVMTESKKQHHATMFMFNGDMIMGYGDASLPASMPATTDAFLATDLAQNATQYAFWRGQIASTLEAGTYVVPVPGNHEVQCSTKINKSCSSANGGKNALVSNETAWRSNMGDLILDATRFQSIVGKPADNFSVANNPCPSGVGCTDGTTTDQSKLSFSFDVGFSHFVIINTDAVGRDSHAPTTWLANDFAAAKTRGAVNFFVFGHKPAYTYYYAGADLTKKSGLDADEAGAAAFWSVIQQYGATYFCGHEHIFNAMQPQPSIAPPAGSSKWSAYQILVGSGGSPFDAPSTDPLATDRMYAWATVAVRASGKVNVNVWGFPTDFSATQKIYSVNLNH